jgi:SOS-response transcriptional repressor LexA
VITLRQEAVLRSIARLTLERGKPPTLRELGLEVGTSDCSLSRMLDILEDEGYLSLGPVGQHRSMRLTALGDKHISARRVAGRCADCGVSHKPTAACFARAV